MAKVNGPLLSLEAHGTINKKLTFTKTRDQQFARLRNVPTGAPSLAQLEQRAAYSDACAAWQALTQPQKDDWKAAGAAVGLSGFSAFVRYELTNTGPAMLYLTQTELGAGNNAITFHPAAPINNIYPATYLCYFNASSIGQNSTGYIFGKTPSGTLNGPRFYFSATNKIDAGASQLTTGNAWPYRNGATNRLTPNQWMHAAYTKTSNGYHYDTIGLHYKTDGAFFTESAYSAQQSAGGSARDDSSLNLVLMNRDGGTRAFYGSYAYLAIWNRVLSLAELDTAADTGPYSVPDGLVFLYANGADIGPNALPIHSRSTYQAGAMPPNLNLGPQP